MILVVAEHKDNKLKAITGELLVFAQRVARDFNQPVSVVLLGSNVDRRKDSAAHRSAEV